MLPLSLFSNRRFSVGAAVNTTAFIVLLGYWFLLVLYVQFSLGYSALQAGLATLPEAVAGMLIAPLTPRFTNRFGAPRVMAAGFVTLVVSLGLLGLVDSTTGYWFLLAPIVLAGIGLSLTTIPATYDIMATTPLAKAGVGSAVNDTSREIGAALGIAILGTISTVVYRRTIDTEALAPALADAAADSPGAALETASVLEGAGELTAGQVGVATAEVAAAFSRAFAIAMIAAAVLAALSAIGVLVASRTVPSGARAHTGS